MSELRFENLTLPGRKLGKCTWFPAVRELIKSEISADLDENDGLFIGDGMLPDSMPYTMLDKYDTPIENLTFQTSILENQYLKAVFLPELGGRLWSLYDKEHQRDLILSNTAFLPCNLGIRNAWFAGGVEFYCGRRGYDEQTCSPRFTAVVEGDTHVLRFYEFQRDRNVPFQYDCFLPDDSRFLYIRVRIWNKNREVVPMYWWSNIALPEVKDSRIVVPAFNTFVNWYSGGSHALAKLAMPDGEGFDASYPINIAYVKDYFYNIPEDARRYECIFYPDGYWLCYASTRRLRGRKLFVWGQSQGGRNWNRKLLGKGLDSYIEIQGGLGRSQQECLPMPPRTSWEWIEAYGAIQMKPFHNNVAPLSGPRKKSKAILLGKLHKLRESVFFECTLETRTSKNWLDDTRFDTLNCLFEEGHRTGMRLWLFDGLRSPSGSAAWRIPEQHKRLLRIHYAYMHDAGSFSFPVSKPVAEEHFFKTISALCVPPGGFYAQRADGAAGKISGNQLELVEITIFLKAENQFSIQITELPSDENCPSTPSTKDCRQFSRRPDQHFFVHCKNEPAQVSI